MNPLKAQVMSLPELLKEQYADLEPKSRNVLSTPEIYSLQHMWRQLGCGNGDEICFRGPYGIKV